MNEAAMVNITMVTNAISFLTRYAALNAITESFSNRCCARRVVLNALISLIEPNVSWIVEVTSDVAARYTREKVLTRGIAQWAQSRAGTTSVPAMSAIQGLSKLTSATHV